MKTLITGGTVVNATGRGAADVLIDGETIVALLSPGSTALGVDLAAHVDRVIDATGKYVIPDARRGGVRLQDDTELHGGLPLGVCGSSAVQAGRISKPDQRGRISAVRSGTATARA
ncbi:hypothetical protein AGMMS50218_18050 [Actinomycetota bacterium]|nr:hypothetical protein AGMMS50218_18050 [Actinomycetota bacterium]